MLPSQAVSRFHRVSLGTWPTPMEPMDNLRMALGGPALCPRLWVKHEDLLAIGGGGNKLRKLEFIMGKAQAEGVDTVINTGGVQSNQTRQTAGAAARLGMECHLLLRRAATSITPIYEKTGNILLCRLLGAHIHFLEEHEDRAQAMEQLALTLREAGRHPMVIPVGASTAEGVLGSAMCGEEILEQADSLGFCADWVVVTVGSAGTCAGIFAGLEATRLHHAAQPLRVLGVDVLGSATDQSSAQERLRQHGLEAAQLLDIPLDSSFLHPNEALVPSVSDGAMSRLEFTGAFAGPGYARSYPAMLDALQLVARTEGLFLDPIYTGKTMTALIAAIRNRMFHPSDNVVFLHSGGQPSLFAYAPELIAHAAHA